MAQGHPQGWKGPKGPQRATLSRHSKGTEAQRGEGTCLRSLRRRRKEPSLRCLTQSCSTAPDGPWRPQGLGPCSQPGSQVSSQTNPGQAPPVSPATPPPPSVPPSSRLRHAQRPRHPGSCDDFRPLFSQSPCVDILLGLLLSLQNSAWMSPPLIRFPKPPLSPPRLGPLLISLSG